jgi:hypothetical protein
VGAITEDLSGNVWAGTRRNGLYILDRSKNVFIPFMPDASEGMKYINFLCPDTSGNLWIASFNNGLYKLNINRRTISNFRHEPGDPNSLPGNYLLRLHMDKQERLWIASWGGGLTGFEFKSGRFYRYLNVPGDTTTIADNIVYTVHTAKINDKEMLWVGTGAGISYATLDSWPALKFSSLTVANGLPNNTVYCILDDSNGNLWISTNSGLSRYDPARNQFRNFYEEDGLQSREFNGGVGYKISGGYLIFGGINGLNLFHPDSILENTYTPGIRINTVFVSNDVYKKDRNLFEGIIILSHQQNFLSFGFSALDFLQPEKIEYAYKLEGVDADWVYCQNRRLANYTNLKPGSYVFRARSTNSGKVWSGNETGLEITIIPPFWKTWWFRSLTGMIFLFLLFVAHRLRVRRILELERLRVRIASDLHDDFGSALTRIAIHSEQIRNTDARGIDR